MESHSCTCDKPRRSGAGRLVVAIIVLILNIESPAQAIARVAWNHAVTLYSALTRVVMAQHAC